MNTIDRNDIFAGYWIPNAPYVFVNNDDDIKECKRKYLTKKGVSLVSSSQNECGWVVNYFKSTSDIQTEISVRMEGRNYYITDMNSVMNSIMETLTIPKPFPKPSRKLNTELIPFEQFNNIRFDMASLICLGLSGNTTRGDNIGLLNFLKSCDVLTSECKPCTMVGNKIAQSLIKIASTRIFADPSQSIMELPVNSIDAYNPNRKIGKFGMGFFSILYWLIGHPKRSLIIESFYHAKEDTPYVSSYRVVIQEHPKLKILTFTLTVFPLSDITKSGVMMALDTERDPFSKEETNEFIKQMNKFRFAQGVQLYFISPYERVPYWDFSSGNKHNFFVAGDSPDKQIFVRVNKTGVLVEDYATGIPISILLGSLFVPSISTKKIETSLFEPEPFINKSRITKEGFGLFFLIGGVSILHITGTPRGFILDLPLNTRLPVSRDDIIMTEATETEILKGLEILFEESAKTYKSVASLQTLLKKYIIYTPNSANRDVIEKGMDVAYIKYESRFVPYDYGLYKFISDNFVGSLEYNVFVIEEEITKLKENSIDRNIWYGVKVLFLDEPTFTVDNAKLPNFVFIGNNYKKNLKLGWKTTITNSYTKRALYPVGAAFSEKNIEKYNVNSSGKFVSNVIKSKKVLDMVYTTMNIIDNFDNKKYILQLGDKFFGAIIDVLLKIYKLTNEEQMLTILEAIVTKIVTYKGNETYGGTLDILIRPSAHLAVSKIEHAKKAHKKFLFEDIIAQINATQETGMFEIQLGTFTSVCDYWAIADYRQKILEEIRLEALRQSKKFVIYTTFLRGFFVGIMKASRDIDISFLSSTKKKLVSDMISKIELFNWSPDEAALLYKNDHLAKSPIRYSYKSPVPFIDKQTIYALEFIKLLSKTNFSVIPPVLPEKVYQTFRLTQLINTAFKENIPSKNKDLFDFFKKSSKESQDLPLQIVEIAINEGTVKSFTEAILTELFQNSLDAIREMNPHNKTIDISYGMNAKHIVLSIKDYVGMSTNSFIYIGIPFLSTKSPSELVTGEMGSGFFNVYRESDAVKITTVKDGIMNISYDKPIIRNKRAVDVEKMVSVNLKTKHPNYTEISISIPVTTEDQKAEFASKIEYTVRSVLSIAKMPGELRLNGDVVNIPLTVLANAGDFIEVCDFGEVIERTESTQESYILTKGIPFSTLKSFYEGLGMDAQDLETGVCLNIKHGGYTPVQTRTKVIIDQSMRTAFVTARAYLMFVKALNKFTYDTIHYYYLLDHFFSYSSVNQLRMVEYTTIDPFNLSQALKYVNFEGNLSIAELINECITIMGEKEYSKVESEISKHLEKYKTSNASISDKVKLVIKAWLKPKNKQIVKNPPQIIIVDEEDDEAESKDDEAGDDEVGEKDKTMTHIFDVLSEEYWSLGSILKIEGFNKIRPRVVVYKPRAKPLSYSGVYRPISNSIDFELSSQSPDELQTFVKLVKNKNQDALFEKMRGTKFWNNFFEVTTLTSTFAHELEHARRKDDHSTSGHGPIFYSMMPCEPKQERSFSQSTNFCYNTISARGFWEKALKNMNI